MNGRILAVDPGEKRLGIAVSDVTATIANPLAVIEHVARLIDAAAVAQLAKEQDAVKIVVGQALDSEGYPGPAARRSARLAEAIRTQTDLPIEFWDESDSTRSAQAARVAMGVPRSKRKGHMDDLAAVVILQSYLDANIGTSK
ncbi:MAG: Holliday junction resolvase RuvX [Anaerolineaceae bacterium]|nr:Holliday junction resolvase RuvX [Anaerolineaceae bacterium]